MQSGLSRQYIEHMLSDQLIGRHQQTSLDCLIGSLNQKVNDFSSAIPKRRHRNDAVQGGIVRSECQPDSLGRLKSFGT